MVAENSAIAAQQFLVRSGFRNKLLYHLYCLLKFCKAHKLALRKRFWCFCTHIERSGSLPQLLLGILDVLLQCPVPQLAQALQKNYPLVAFLRELFNFVLLRSCSDLGCANERPRLQQPPFLLQQILLQTKKLRCGVVLPELERPLL